MYEGQRKKKVKKKNGKGKRKIVTARKSVRRTSLWGQKADSSHPFTTDLEYSFRCILR